MAESEPRPYTTEEMREMFLSHLQTICDYWITVKLDRPEHMNRIRDQGEIRYRMEGMLFSMLVLFDGGSGMMPAFDITPSPHENDKEYCQSIGENWWVPEVINNIQLHEIYSSRGRKPK